MRDETTNNENKIKPGHLVKLRLNDALLGKGCKKWDSDDEFEFQKAICMYWNDGNWINKRDYTDRDCPLLYLKSVFETMGNDVITRHYFLWENKACYFVLHDPYVTLEDVFEKVTT